MRYRHDKYIWEKHHWIGWVIVLTIVGLWIYWLFVPSKSTVVTDTKYHPDCTYEKNYRYRYLMNCNKKQGDDYVRCLAIAPEPSKECQ